MRPLIWFRGDLRTEDNPALSEATRDATRGCVAVFAVCPSQWLEHDWSDWKVDLLRRTLALLEKDLAKLNIPLRILTKPMFDEIPDALLGLAHALECDAVYFNDEHEWNERQRDERVEDAFEGAGLGVRRFTDQVVFEPGSLRTGAGNYYSVFSPFKRAWLARADEHTAWEQSAPKPKKQPEMVAEPSGVPVTIDGFGTQSIDPGRWPAGEHAAMEGLSTFCDDKIRGYKDDRDTPALDGTSVLSPPLAIGSITHRQCLLAARDANHGKLSKGHKSIDHWISEILWREFYRHFIVGFPRVSRNLPFKLDTTAIEWASNDDHFEAWTEARTGVPIVDAAMRQLLETGWMHNRLRMIVAMYLTKDLFIDWRRGESFFMRHLVDGDLASNNGGWQWSASTGADAAPYFRIFNPYSQSKKCDPDAKFIKRYLPELEGVDPKDIHDPSKIPSLLRSQLDYPEPIVDHAKARDRVLEAFKAIKDPKAETAN